MLPPSRLSISPESILKFSNFQKRLSLNRKQTNKAFNPKDHWRYRPRQTVKKTDHIAFFTLNDRYNQPMTQQILCFLPTDHIYAPLYNLSYKLNLTRIALWWRSLKKTLGYFVTLKLKYKGKSFRWHRKLRSVLLRFGHSHLVFAKPIPGTFWRKHGRQKIIFWGSNGNYLLRFLKKTVSWRPMNIYHGRGLRVTKQKVWRKSGKVSAYR